MFKYNHYLKTINLPFDKFYIFYSIIVIGLLAPSFHKHRRLAFGEISRKLFPSPGSQRSDNLLKHTGDVVTADGPIVLGWPSVEKLPMQLNTAARNINNLINKVII
ncbi:hypothetical protein HB770_18590 [Rhizobium leguminosarum bv. viciae]|uniref:Transmembrane protein n=1 Tax=Rhizobium leguminosarum bv. viciae TaxID=387 RepID=A0A7G6RKN0_RHILV|nr:hypothetical protein HB770_18590 [Rhizobium leguminosarum bv. viciae]